MKTTSNSVRRCWTSRKMYRQENGSAGHLIQVEATGIYYMVDATKALVLVDQEFAQHCREAEDRVNRRLGRPLLFPSERVTVRLITLPDRLWKIIGTPYSANLARILTDLFGKELIRKG